MGGSKRARRRRTDPQANAQGPESIPSWTFTPVLDGPIPPFTLHLIGKDEGKLTIPPELMQEPDNGEPLVQIHSNGEYPQFYRAIASMVSMQHREASTQAETSRTWFFPPSRTISTSRSAPAPLSRRASYPA